MTDTHDVDAEVDFVNHPVHYGSDRFGIECIEFTRLMSFDAGNAFKYIWRHAEKNGDQDLDKALWYLADIVASESPIYLSFAAAKRGADLTDRWITPWLGDEQRPEAMPYVALEVLGFSGHGNGFGRALAARRALEAARSVSAS